MRNLFVHRIEDVRLSNQDAGGEISSTPAICAFDTTNEDLIFCLGPSAERPVINLRRWSKSAGNTTTITTWDAPCPLPDLPHDKVLSLHHQPISRSICLVLAGGDLVIVRENPTSDQEKIEIVGSIDVGIVAAEWSWDGSVLAVLTREGSLVLMSQNLEPRSETVFAEADLGLSKHVSVGWGKRETQFKGKRAAAALRDPTMPEFVEQGKASPFEDNRSSISWRGDGAYVAVNSAINSSRRTVRVFSAEGVLDSVSEPVDGLESSLSWRPYGNLIASIKRTSTGPAKAEVVFFERNGLRHGQFDLRLKAEDPEASNSPIDLAWNRDSTVLAVKLHDHVQLWTMGNYHYYHKQDLKISASEAPIWHPTRPLELILANNDRLQMQTLTSGVTRGSLVPPFDYGLVAVIDGCKLKLTPFRHVGVPPPMAFVEVEADSPIIACAMSKDCERLVYVTHSHLYHGSWQMRKTTGNNGVSRHSTKIDITRVDLPQSLLGLNLQVYSVNDLVCILAPFTRNRDAECFCYPWHTFTSDKVENLITDRSLDVPSKTRALVVDSRQERVWARTDESLVSLDSDSAGSVDLAMTPAITQTEIATFPATDEPYQSPSIPFALDDAGILSCHGYQKVQDCTSLVVTDDYVVYTTSNHLLKFAHLRPDYSEIVWPADTPEVDERVRAVERGAKIVTIMPSVFAVVLQMPRGNLETIYSRTLVLAGIRRYIKNKQYLAAFLACQSHQVDLNIMHDLDPEAFLANIALVVEQLQKPSRIDEFIQKLQPQDVTESLYKDTSINGTDTDKREAAKSSHSSKSDNEKVNKICDAFINHLTVKSTKDQQNVITAHVCKRPADLTSALRLVSDTRKTSEEEADIAVAHLCFLSDTNRLYDAALALYDLDLTLLVAQNAQRDPREYVPFLRSLQALPPLRRQYTIDNHLRKYAKALTSLHQLSEHDEVQAYTIKHSLYSTAEELYKNDTIHLSSISKLHADYLTSQSRHADAATLYESLHLYEEAYPLYTLSHQWREALTCASLIPLSTEKLSDLAQTLATSCAEESRDYRSAAAIYTEYLDNPNLAAELLCKGSYFAEATRVLCHPSRSLFSQIPIIVDTALTRKFGEIIELIAECTTQLKAQVPRIEELRIKKAEDPLAFFGGDSAAMNGVGEGVDIPDNISLAPTDASTLAGKSMFTRYGGGAGGSQVSTKFGGTVASNMSRKTSKTKRREERKRAMGKKGSIYEEEYLVGSVARLVERVNGVHEEVGRLISGLRRRGFREQAVVVDRTMKEIETGCEDARVRVWRIEKKEKAEMENMYHVNGDGRPPGADGVLYDSQVEGEVQKPPPEVSKWKSGFV